MVWKLEDAKNRFSELVRRARGEGPQVVTRHGRPAAVVLSVEEYQALTEGSGTLVDFLRASPLADAVRCGELELEREPAFARDFEL